MGKDLSIKYGDIAIDFDDTNSVKTYLKIEMFHINRFRAELDVVKSVVTYANMPEDNQIKFLKKLVSYERKHKYNYKKSTYKTICGICIELLLPRKITSKAQKIKLVTKFMDNVNPLKYRVPWIAYEVQRGSATIIKILLSEREYLDHEEIKRYNRNYYDQKGEITHKKGDPMIGKDGKVIKELVLWSKKTRMFTFKRETFKKMVKQLTDQFIIAIKSVLEKINTRFRIKKKNAKGKWHFFNRKVCIEINVMKQYVEWYCNYAVYLQRDRYGNPEYEEYRGKAIPVPKIKEIIEIFHKYKARLEKGNFHDREGVLRLIAYKRTPLPQLQENLEVLKQEFKFELNLIVSNVFT